MFLHKVQNPKSWGTLLNVTRHLGSIHQFKLMILQFKPLWSIKSRRGNQPIYLRLHTKWKLPNTRRGYVQSFGSTRLSPNWCVINLHVHVYPLESVLLLTTNLNQSYGNRYVHCCLCSFYKVLLAFWQCLIY